MTILLAPMEGLLDFTLRDILTRVGGIDRCVSEFIRVTDTLLPERAFKRIVPELNHGGRTPAGVPVRAQLLGSDPHCMAENAARLATLGPAGIDLNFGCPARIVNRHGGGAALLQEPELVGRIVAAVRRAVPADMPVSAKMRLGFHDDALAEECARAVAENGANELVVHGRTKAHGYRPPAYWARIADVRAAVAIPVIANGEIWTLDDARRCKAESGCEGLMLGRGAVADPGLALAILADAQHAPADDASASTPLTWPTLTPLIGRFWVQIGTHCVPKYRAGRLKQWLNYLRRTYPEAEQAYQDIRTIHDSRLVEAWLRDVGWLGALTTEPDQSTFTISEDWLNTHDTASPTTLWSRVRTSGLSTKAAPSSQSWRTNAPTQKFSKRLFIMKVNCVPP
jgi:tRNA-dihydrouridine synthase C